MTKEVWNSSRVLLIVLILLGGAFFIQRLELSGRAVDGSIRADRLGAVQQQGDAVDNGMEETTIVDEGGSSLGPSSMSPVQCGPPTTLENCKGEIRVTCIYDSPKTEGACNYDEQSTAWKRQQAEKETALALAIAEAKKLCDPKWNCALPTGVVDGAYCKKDPVETSSGACENTIGSNGRLYHYFKVSASCGIECTVYFPPNIRVKPGPGVVLK